MSNDTTTTKLANAVLADKGAVDRVIKIYNADDISAHTIRIAFGAARHDVDARTVTNAQYYGAFKMVVADLLSDGTIQSSIDASTLGTATMSTVKTDVAIQDVTYIFGRDLNTLSHADILGAIKRVQDDIKALTETGVDSKYVKAQVKLLTDTINQLVAKLDSLSA